ncbi:phosphate ABC transporter substrate-binding protein PstS [Lentisphaerota bacterium WC36G]|nr:phosphate ABC transporter substrate-binding protein PstS [Lentisphaerae bacterium WC36]
MNLKNNFNVAILSIATLLSATTIPTKAATEVKLLNGAGASFPAPVYRLWTYMYHKKTKIRINYQSVGSGAGVSQIKANTVDFAGTDAPLKEKELIKHNLVQFPMLTGGVVLVVNLPKIKNNAVKLSKTVIADIFLGKITNWSDSKIKILNPKITLPNQKITVVTRADSSGTTWIFTNYLSKISQEWGKKIGFGKAIKWPVGISGQKNPGIVNNVKKTIGAIGYVEYTYATESKLPTVCLENADGKYVEPNPQNFSAAASNANWKNAPGFYMILTNQPGEKSWPITGVTYILTKKGDLKKKLAAMHKYFRWCYGKEGAKIAEQLHYVPIPQSVVNIVEKKCFK